MANKRQKKKQQKQQNIKKLLHVGVAEKKARQIASDPKQVTKIIKAENRRLTANKRSEIIRSLGYSLKEHGTKRYWKEDRFTNWYNQELKKKQKADRRKQNKLKNASDDYLLIFWRDKTAEGYADSDTIKNFIYEYSHVDNEALIENILFYLHTEKVGHEIGTTLSVIVKGNQIRQYTDFMTHYSGVTNQLSDSNDWILVYKGKAVRYHELLVAIHAVIRLLYDPSEKADFIGTLIQKMLPRINLNMARRLANDLKWREF